MLLGIRVILRGKLGFYGRVGVRVGELVLKKSSGVEPIIRMIRRAYY